MMDDVYNAERDLTTKKDVEKVRPALGGKDSDKR